MRGRKWETVYGLCNFVQPISVNTPEYYLTVKEAKQNGVHKLVYVFP